MSDAGESLFPPARRAAERWLVALSRIRNGLQVIPARSLFVIDWEPKTYSQVDGWLRCGWARQATPGEVEWGRGLEAENARLRAGRGP